MRVFALGSCRIHNPLAISHRAGEVTYLNPRIRSRETIYLHNPNEMIQFCRAAAGEMSIAADLAHFVFIWGLPEFNADSPAVLRDAEQFIIEVCTDKHYEAFGHALSLNEIARQLVDPAKDAGQAWWKALNSRTPADADLISAVEQALRDAKKLTPLHSALLREIVFRQLSSHELADGMAALRALVDRPILVVPHVAVRLPDGRDLADRTVHITKTIDAAKRLGFPVLEPRTFVERDGQANALAKGGADFNHYAEDYLPTAGREIVRALEQQSRLAA